RSGREELYVTMVDGQGEPQKLTDIDALKNGYNWSPDSKEIAFTASDSKLRKITVASKQIVELDSSRYSNISTPEWSPDGKWLAYSKADSSRTTDIYLLAASGEDKQAHKITFDSYDERSPRFAPDGRKLFFVRSETTGGGGGGGFGNASVQIHSVGLERLERDPDDPEERPEAESPQPPAGEGEGAGAPRRPMNRPPQAEGEGGAGFGFGGGISDLNISRDGRTLFFKERDGIYSVPLGTGAATTGATTTAAAGRGTTGGGGVEGARRRISFNVRVKI